MSDVSRLKLVDGCAAVVVGTNMADVMGLYAVLLLAAMDGARHGTDVPEPPSFARLRADLRVFLITVGWDDIAITIAQGHVQ